MHTQLALIPSQMAVQSRRNQAARLTQRLFLYANELYRVPSFYRQLRTRHGIAHISQGGKDFIIHPGEWLTLTPRAGIALVSPLSSESLVLELFQ